MINAILNLLVSLMANGHVYTIAYTGDVKMNKGGRKGIEPNPLFGRVTRKGHIQLRLVSYATSREKFDGTSRDETIAPLWGGKGKHISTFVVEHVDTGKKYLMCDKTMAKYLDYMYFVDDRNAADSEIETIKRYLPKKEESSIFCLAIDDIVSVKAEGKIA